MKVQSVFSYAASYTARTPGWDSSVEDVDAALLSPEAKAALDVLGNVMGYLGSTQYGGLDLDAYDFVQDIYNQLLP